MILQCPACSARFAVPDALIPPEGRTVKCGRCAEQWHADGPAATEGEALDFAAMAQAAQDEAEIAPVMPRQLPVRQPEPLPAAPFAIAAIVMGLAWLVLAFMSYYPRWVDAPVLGSVYAAFDIYPSDGLLFEDISMQRNENGAQTQFLLTGSITNHAATTRMVPTVRVQLKDADGEAIWARSYDVNEPLAAGEPYAFRIDNVETSFGPRVHTVVLDLGHALQLNMR